MSRVVAVATVLMALCAGVGVADPVPADRKTDWTYTGVPGGIPHRTTICASYTAATPPDVATINAAIVACSAAGGGVVYFGPGTYDYSGIVLASSNVTVRGAGAHLTTFRSGSADSAINLGGSLYAPDVNIAITGSGVIGTTTITVATTTGLAVGQMVELARDNYTFVRIPSGGPARALHQMNLINGIDGTTVTLQNPLLHDYTAGTPVVVQTYSGFTSLSGIEDLKLDHSGSADTYGLWIQNVYACWLKGVESYNAYGYHVEITQALNLEVRDSYFHKVQTPGQNSNGQLQVYGNLTYGVNSSGKFENNIFDKFFPAVCFNNSSSGFYVGYNYFYASELNATNNALNYVTWGMDDNHGPYQVFSLWEGNVGEMWGSDSYYGGSSHGLVVRNHLTGYHPRSTKTPDHSGGYIGNPVRLQEASYYYSLVGNVLGSPALDPAKYAETQDLCGGVCTAVYRLGYPNMGNSSLTDVVPLLQGIASFPDPDVAGTLLRWGNYDYYTDATRWEASEIPTGVEVPADHVLPNSYYYAAIPSWWPIGVAWPPIGPDVTGGTGAGNGSADTTGHTNKTPAQLCFERLGLANEGTATFSAASCYAPSAPSNVRIK